MAGSQDLASTAQPAEEPAGRVDFGPGVKGPQVVVVANRTGGQGKTLASQLIIAAYPRMRSYCADSRDAVVDGSRKSKLARMVEGTVDFGAGPTEDDFKEDPKVYSRFWDPFGLAVLMGDAKDVDSSKRAVVAGRANAGKPMLIDFGANVVDSFLDWSKSSGGAAAFDTGTWRAAFDFVIPVVSSPQSIGDALSIVERLRTGEHVPVRRIVLVLNEIQGPFPQDGDGPFEALTALVRVSGGVVVPMPRIDNKGLRFFEAKNRPVSDISRQSGVKLGADLEIGVFEGNRVYREAKGWFDAVTSAFREALKPSAGFDHERVEDDTQPV